MPKAVVSLTFIALASICVVSLAEPKIKIEIRQGSEVVAIVGDLEGLLQVRADKSKTGSKSGTSILTGNVRITAVHKNKRIAHIQATEAVVETRRIEVQIYDYVYQKQMGVWVNQLEDFGPVPIAPMYALSQALKAHPQIKYFRMRFGLSLGGDRSSSVILYDRSQKSVKYRGVGSVSEGQRGYQENFLYTGVTDTIIHKLIEQHGRDAEGSTDASFHLLTSYGCKRIKLQH